MINRLHRRSCLKSLAATALLSLAGGLVTVGSSAARASNSAGAAKNPRVLIVYFTWAGSTEVVAKEIQRLIGGDLVRITRVESYPTEYAEVGKAAKAELEKDVHPAIVPQSIDVENYDIVCIGHPIWNGRMPMPLYSFLDRTDLSGKLVLHFCTHGGSSLADTHEELARLAPGARLPDGLAVYGWHGVRGIEKVAAWLADLGLLDRREIKPF